MAVKIIISRQVPQGMQSEVLPLLKELRSLAISQPGYISGETLRNVENAQDYVVISTWQSVEDWNSWAGNSRRAEIQKKVDALLGKETTYGVYFYG